MNRGLGSIICVLAGLLLSIQSSMADPVGDRMLDVFRAWAREFPLERASIAIVRNGEVVGVAATGRPPPEASHPIASLSKAVTGLCILRLVEQGRLRFESTIGDVLGGALRRRGAQVDQRFRNTTLAQLLTHTSGFTDEMRKGLGETASPDEIAMTAATRRIPNAPGRHQYANVNFAILDRIVEEATGQRYGAACRRLVLDPVGAGRATLFHRYRPPPVWVDYDFAPADFGRLMRYFDEPSQMLRIGIAQWPKVDIGGGNHYGPGVAMRHNPDGSWSLWHAGGYAWTTPRYRINYASWFIYWGHRVGFYLNLSPIDDKARDTLNQRLYDASLQPGAPPPRPPPDGKPEYSTNRPGADYRVFEIEKSRRCQDECALDARCVAATHVRPNPPGQPKEMCHLKTAVPAPVRDFCCTTFIVR